jgi:hypothetical protein
VSMWSINRDQQCGANFSLPVLSNNCSGIPESNLEMTDVFNHLNGSAETSDSSSEAVLVPALPDTNPANAPFPMWNPISSYAVHLPGRREWRDLPGQVVQLGTRSGGAVPVLMGIPVGVDRAGASLGSRAGHRSASAGDLPELDGQGPLRSWQPRALPGTSLPGEMVEPRSHARH